MEFWKQENVFKTEQSTAKGFYIHKAQTMVRLLEVFSALIIVFWSTTRLPLALRLSIDFAKQTCALLLATPSVFLIGNAIVVTLFAQFQTHAADPKSDLYDEYVSESRSRSQIIQTQEIEKQVVVPLLESPAVAVEAAEVVFRCCRRTQSERVVVRCDEVKKKKNRKELRRSRTTEKSQCGTKMKAKTASCEAVDELTGDEFRRRVEAFIAKQQMFIRDENMALVVSN